MSTPPVLHLRRAINSWWYAQNYRARNQGYRGRATYGERVQIKVLQPKRRYARSTGARAMLTHLVRDVVRATDSMTGSEARMTRYRCGAYSWQAELSWDAAEICAHCALVESGARSVRVSHKP